jgi:hypothetical protein
MSVDIAGADSFIHFHRDLSAPAMSTDMSQEVSLSSLLFIYFLSFYLSRFSFYINIMLV